MLLLSLWLWNTVNDDDRKKKIFADQEKVSDYEMKLMDLDVEQLGIPVSND